MNAKRGFCTILAILSIFWCFGATAWAAEEGTQTEKITIPMSIARAFGTFSISIPAHAEALGDTNFHLDAGEIVTISASYTPSSSSIDYGLVGPDNKFYYWNTKNGRISRSIKVETRGYYTLQLRNNSSSEVNVSGTVRY